MRFVLLYIACFFVTFLSSQEGEVQGRVIGNGGSPLIGASVYVKEDLRIAMATDAKGKFKLSLKANKSWTIVASYLGYVSYEYKINLKNGQQYKLDVRLSPKATAMDSVVVERERIAGEIKIDLDAIEAMPGPTQSVEGILKTLGVASNNEISTQYSVRGGNYDENLIYVNDFQIYRPQLIRSGQQEGMSFINSDLLSNLKFFPGGFSAEYGDKMSSVLDVSYKQPDSFATKISGSLLGGSVSLEGRAIDSRMTYLIGSRYMSNRYLLNGMDVEGAYQPTFYDFQSFFNFLLSSELELGFLAYYSKNDYKMVPQTQITKFGGIQQALQFKVYFEGQEVNRYETAMGGVSLKYADKKRNRFLKWLASAYKSKEDETFDVIGEYWLSAVDMDFGSDDFGQELYSLGVGGFHNFGRNYLDVLVANTEIKGGMAIDKHFFQAGIKYQYEQINDQLNEWIRLDSAGYSLLYSTDQVLLHSVLKSQTDLASLRSSAYMQDRWTKVLEDSSLLSVTAGLRYQLWDLNKEHLFSPRFQVTYRPKWSREVRFYTANGVYYQAPFYRELRDLYGEVNTNVKAQKSIHITAGTELVLKAWGRDFRFVTDLYYKKLDNLIPYEIDNVRIRYHADNSARGYAAGVDLRLHGEFVEDAESWMTLSLLKTEEDIIGDYYYSYQNADGDKVNPYVVGWDEVADSARVEPGFIPRPTDQRLNFGMYFQDYFPDNKNFKMHLNFLFGTGFKFGPPDFSRFKDTLSIPPYRRVDLGFSAQLLDGKKERIKASKYGRHFKSIWASIEFFNLLGISNTISYLWVRDISTRQYAVPNYLTSRRVNLRLIAKF